MNDRKKQILQAIIEEYIQTAEPVSSNAIVQKYNLDYSSATVRNEMADLEKEGFLDKPHTSAGRIPSAKGYRFYVDELLKEDNISLEEVIYIQSKLQTKVNQMEDLTKITTNTLSEITHYPTVSIGPNKHNQIIEDIKFVLLGTRTMMAIILTDSGIIKETIIKFDEDVTEEQVPALESLIRQLETQLTIKNKMMTQSFEDTIAKVQQYQIKLNTANANLGSRYARLEMVEERLTAQYTEYEELLSENIDADLVETYINLTSADTVYNASLQTAAKIAQNSLLDFIN